jgi:oxaloacetate decarboxylase (Na+ extruding) subunit alpha
MNLERIEAVLQLLQRQTYVGELSVAGDGWRLQVRRGRYFPLPPLEEASEEVSSDTPERLAVRAGMVGVFRSLPNSPRRGDHVALGDQVGNIDSMRIPNPVVAEEAGYITDILVEDGEPVEYGQELFALSAEQPVE